MARVRRRPTSRSGRGGAEAALNALVTRGLSKRYGGVPAVDGLDLSVDRGVLYGFLGPNGAGKTTTIRMLLHLILPSQGEVEVLGEPVFRQDGRRGESGAALRRVGAMVEEPAFWRFLSGRRNLRYFAKLTGPPEDRNGRLARVDEVLGLVGLTDAAEKKVKAYSQGMRQRLGIALALLGQPDLLVLDEPTNGLDPQGMREIRLLLRGLADQGTTVFVSSHLLWEVDAMCDRVGVLARGRLVAEGRPQDLRGASDRIRIEVDDEPRARAILATITGLTVEPAGSSPAPTDPAPPAVATIRVHLAPPATPAGLNATLVGAGIAVSALVPERDSLEQVFLSLVEGADVPR